MVDTADDSEPSSRRRASLFQKLTRVFARETLGSAAAVEEALRVREENGEQIELAQKDMILRAARFDRLKVADVMRPRAEIVAIEANATLGEAARVFSESQHSRLPLYGETLDDPQGFIHVRDVLSLLTPDEAGEAKAQFSDRALSRIRREILYVPQSMTLATLFLKMQSSRIHLALVVDEYGGTDGLVSMEDLVEQIVGAIEDEHDEDAALVVERPGGAFEVDGRAPIDQLETKLGVSLAMPDHEDEFDTVGGLAVVLAGRLPQRGEILHHPAGFDVEIIDSDPRRVKRIRVKRSPEASVTKLGAITGGEIPNDA
ncbi:hemolysin family protein [Vitreimonas flagellata]|uniref:hemolysin family protein n=1 Tax=Vitreimonas flagellata TaxID=2560861 RepID=UPI001074A17F|nr:hemolysin family protein [Vitreimonas flagellata]